MRDGHVTGVQTCALPISPVQTVLAVDVLAAFVQVLLPLAEKPVVFAALVVFVPFSQRVVAQEIPASLAFVAFLDRKSTRLNSSHVAISYAVFCLKNNK